jgi:hypothetical protein
MPLSFFDPIIAKIQANIPVEVTPSADFLRILEALLLPDLPPAGLDPAMPFLAEDDPTGEHKNARPALPGGDG